MRQAVSRVRERSRTRIRYYTLRSSARMAERGCSDLMLSTCANLYFIAVFSVETCARLSKYISHTTVGSGHGTRPPRAGRGDPTGAARGGTGPRPDRSSRSSCQFATAPGTRYRICGSGIPPASALRSFGTLCHMSSHVRRSPCGRRTVPLRYGMLRPERARSR